MLFLILYSDFQVRKIQTKIGKKSLSNIGYESKRGHKKKLMMGRMVALMSNWRMRSTIFTKDRKPERLDKNLDNGIHR